MSSTDPMRDGSWILSETMRRISLRPFHFHQLQNTKSSLLMRQITQPMMYNSSYGRLLRSLIATAGSSLPATTKTKSSNLSTPDARWSSLELNPKTNLESQQSSSSVSGLFLRQRVSNMIQKSSSNSSTNTSPTGDVFSTSVKDTPWVVRLIREFSRRSRMFR